MSNTSPPTPPGASQQQQQDQPQKTPSFDQLQFHGTHPVFHYTAMGVAGLALLGIALPPRTWGIRSTLLSSSFFLSSNQLAHDYTGRSFVYRWAERAEKVEAAVNAETDDSRRIKEAIRLEKARRRAALPEEERAKLELQDRAKDNKSKGSWLKEMDEKEKQALKDGKGYGDLILEHIKEAFAVEDQKPAPADEKPKGAK